MNTDPVATIHEHFERQATPEVWSEVDALRKSATAAKNMRLALDTAIKHKLETQTHGGLTEFGKGGLAALEALEREFVYIGEQTNDPL